MTLRSDATLFDEERLRELFFKCDGRIQRIHEILAEDDLFQVGYSTLSKKLRTMGLTTPKKSRCESVPDVPGEEMQHDTTIHHVVVGSKKLKLVASLLYFRYSKARYLKFFRNFDRFRMQCFLHEALTYFGYAAKTCIIDNTNLARLRGSGKTAIITPEMEQFSRKYGFKFICHALNHPNRKAGNERGFYTVETNFFPGRRFSDMAELNRSAFEWATVRQYHRPVGKTAVIAAKAFEYERSFLNKLPAYVEAPYRDHRRLIDQYGYAAFAGNYYWVPGTDRNTVTLLEYDRQLKIFLNKKPLVTYELPVAEAKNQLFFPEGYQKPACRPNNRKRPTEREERILRSMSPEIDDWLTRILREKGIHRHHFIRKIYGLHLKLAPALFIRTISRADKYRIKETKTIEQIAALLVKQSGYEMPTVDIDSDFKHRPSYIEGQSSDPVDLVQYDNLLEDSYE
ncbi:MAG: helix-turn-helix domain-containing protein [Deltaproteobacteria bacterium]|nr:helix-turn-helix domain-containing protein [Deltaproteobacteria bacterium]